MNHMFCFGLGYSALTLAKQLLAQGWRVSGTCRTLEKCESLRTHGITAYVFDNDLPLQEVWDWQSVTHVLCSIPPRVQGLGAQDEGIKPEPLYDPILYHHLPLLESSQNLKWIGYLSTTGVYGDHKGGWVDETTPVNPPNERSRLRVIAEQEWVQTGLPVHIFRLSGIYGPGRSVTQELKEGTAHRIHKEGQVFSRIHVEDIAQILQASIKQPNPGSIYNCADNEPAPQAEVVEYAAKLLGINPPPLVNFEDAELSDMARSFWMSNRRVRNDKIKQDLGLSLKYGSYREGLGQTL